MFLNDLWVKGLAGRVPCSFPSVSETMKMIGHGTRTDLDMELLRDRFTEQRGIPEAFFEQFLVEKLLDCRRDQGELTRGTSVSEAGQTAFFKAGQIVVHGLDITVKVLCQLGNGPAGAVKPQQTRSQTHLWMDMCVEFKITQLNIIVFAESDFSSRASHALIL